MQTRNVSLTELEPEKFTHSRVEKTLCSSSPVASFIVRHRHRNVESRTEQETKSGAFEVSHSCGLQTYLDCCNPKYRLSLWLYHSQDFVWDHSAHHFHCSNKAGNKGHCLPRVWFLSFDQKEVLSLWLRSGTRAPHYKDEHLIEKGREPSRVGTRRSIGLAAKWAGASAIDYCQPLSAVTPGRWCHQGSGLTALMTSFPRSLNNSLLWHFQFATFLLTFFSLLQIPTRALCSWLEGGWVVTSWYRCLV